MYSGWSVLSANLVPWFCGMRSHTREFLVLHVSLVLVLKFRIKRSVKNMDGYGSHKR